MGLVVDAADRMQALIRDILAYSLVGRGEKAFEETDMEAVLSLAMRELGVSIEDAKASIEWGAEQLKRVYGG
jgi:light-regulated signal transduction histidine kinase (bacteriophytochrome)